MLPDNQPLAGLCQRSGNAFRLCQRCGSGAGQAAPLGMPTAQAWGVSSLLPSNGTVVYMMTKRVDFACFCFFLTMQA